MNKKLFDYLAGFQELLWTVQHTTTRACRCGVEGEPDPRSHPGVGATHPAKDVNWKRNRELEDN